VGIFSKKHREKDLDIFSGGIEDVEDFYKAIDNEALSHKLSPERPYVYWTMECYDESNGIKGGGGLGVLAADTRRVAEQLSVPFIMITPFYQWETHQQIENLNQTEYHKNIHYTDFGFEKIGETVVKTSILDATLDVIEKQLGSTRFLCVTEPNFGELYSGDGSGDHRLYQEVSLGFGGYQALKLAGLKPAIIQLNETATFFAALARLDELVKNGMDFYEALVYIRSRTLYTNHTLVQAAESEFSYAQFEQFVFPNIKSHAVAKWLSDKFENGLLKLSTVTLEIAALRSGVSKLHARVANYHDINGDRVKFKAITNGIDINTWVEPEIVRFYHENDILDKFNLPTEKYIENLNKYLTAKVINDLKNFGRDKMNDALSTRADQYGKPVYVPADKLIFQFKRRFTDYKRPWLPFSDIDRLKYILEKYDAHYILSGKAHMGDAKMYSELMRLLNLIDADPALKERVHYIPDYDEEVANALSIGGNISINNPIVGLEACGTSWMKDIANLNILISTNDGGVADMPPENYLEISGSTETAEADSLYRQMETAAKTWRATDLSLDTLLKTELSAYLPVISGARMIKDYLDYLF
jgi:starch phosphorylase